MPEGGTIRLTVVDHCIECDAISLPNEENAQLPRRQRRVKQPRRALSIQRRRRLRPSICLWPANVTAAALNISTSVWGV
jgi:hypothetical protein